MPINASLINCVDLRFNPASLLLNLYDDKSRRIKHEDKLKVPLVIFMIIVITQQILLTSYFSFFFCFKLSYIVIFAF
jgi:hypothetical protein